MEIVWVDRRNGSDRYYLLLPRSIGREEFLAKAKVTEGSYAGRLVDRLYRHIFERSCEIKRDFQLYYQIEYGSFDRYLRRRLLLTKDEAALVAQGFEKAALIIEYKPTYYFLRDDTGRAVLEGLLSAEEAE